MSTRAVFTSGLNTVHRVAGFGAVATPPVDRSVVDSKGWGKPKSYTAKLLGGGPGLAPGVGLLFYQGRLASPG